MARTPCQPRRRARRATVLSVIIAVLAAGLGVLLAPAPAGAAPVTSIRTVGSSGIDAMEDVAIASNGDAVVVGAFSNTATFTGKIPAASIVSSGNTDGFVARYDSGGALLWLRQISGSGSEAPTDVEIDANGNIFVSGNTESTSLSIGGGVPASTGGIMKDGFVARYGADGGPVWIRRVTGNGNQLVNGVAVNTNRVYVAGYAQGTSQVTLTGSGPTVSATPAGVNDNALVGAFDLNGTPQWLRLGQGSDNRLFDVTATPLAVVAVGTFIGNATFASGGSQVQTSTSGSRDGLMVAFTAFGTPAWAKQVGAGLNSLDELRSVEASGDRVYASGYLGTESGVVVAKDLLNGDTLLTQPLQGDLTVEDIDVAADGSIAATGDFVGQLNLAMADGTIAKPTANGSDIFVATVDPTGAGILSFQRDGGAGGEGGKGVAATAAGGAVVVGMFNGPVTFTGNLSITTPVGGVDGFVTRYPIGAAYHGITPARILDTRDGTGGPATKIGPGQTRTLSVVGVGGVPAHGVSSVVFNLTATGATAASHLTVWPTGGSKPTASSLNFGAGTTVPNLVVSRVGANGTVSIFNNSGSVDVIADVVGWFDRDGSGSRFAGVTPARILDTRDGTGGPSTPFGPGTSRDLTVTGVGGVPAGVPAVVLNVTVTGPTAASHLTVWPAGVAKPTASNLNFTTGQTVPNLVVVKVGSGGKVSLFNNSGSVDVIADVVGYYTAAPVEGQLRGTTPSRVLDTRDGTGGSASPFGPGQTRSLQIGGVGSVPSSARAVVVNVTVTSPTAATHLTVWPSGVGMPPSSNLNVVAGQTVANLVMVKLGPDGKVQLRNNSGEVHVIADVVGWYG